MLLRSLRALGSRQAAYERRVVNLIASDNAYPSSQADSPPYCGWMIQEGLVGHRPFAGATIHDAIEELGQRVARNVFRVDHANLQPHSCSQANQAAYAAVAEPGARMLALGFRAGGHLTHGLRVNYSGRIYSFAHYGVGADGLIDYDAARDLARRVRPRVLICGSSSYPRDFDVSCLRGIADEVNALLMLDVSHEAGLIAGGAMTNPLPMADIGTMSLDKTLRGPFSAMVLCRSALADQVDRAVHPGTQSSFSIRRISDAAYALILTQTTAFQRYAKRTVENARTLAEHLLAGGAELLTGGTDKHYVVVNTAASFGLSGTDAEGVLQNLAILTNRQTLPTDGSGRSNASSGLRLGTAWITSRGYRRRDVVELADIIRAALMQNRRSRNSLKDRVHALVDRERPGDVWLELPAIKPTRIHRDRA